MRLIESHEFMTFQNNRSGQAGRLKLLELHLLADFEIVEGLDCVGVEGSVVIDIAGVGLDDVASAGDGCCGVLEVAGYL